MSIVLHRSPAELQHEPYTDSIEKASTKIVWDGMKSHHIVDAAKKVIARKEKE